MKEKVVKAVKGDSVIYVSLFTTDKDGRKTEYQYHVCKWNVSLGGTGGVHCHESSDSAFAEYAYRIGELVNRGYAASLT